MPQTSDHDSGLSGGREFRPRARRRCGTREFQHHGHFADRAIVAHREQHGRLDAVHVTREERNVGRFAHVANRNSGGARGGGKLRIVAEHVVQAADDLEFGVDRLQDLLAPLHGQFAAFGRRSDEQGRGPELHAAAHIRYDGCR